MIDCLFCMIQTYGIHIMCRCWFTAFGGFAQFLASRVMFWAIWCGLFLMWPFGLALNVAQTSTDCDRLTKALNLSRREITSAAQETKVRTLETFLDRLNMKQGLGNDYVTLVVSCNVLGKLSKFCSMYTRFFFIFFLIPTPS